jgi:hypothetical protein
VTDPEITNALVGFERIEVDDRNWTLLYRHSQTGGLLEVFFRRWSAGRRSKSLTHHLL